MSEKHKKVCRFSNYFEYLLAFVSAVSCCASVSEFFVLVGVMKKKREKKHDNMVLLAKDKLNTINVSTSKALIDSYINHNEFFSVNNVLREYS